MPVTLALKNLRHPRQKKLVLSIQGIFCFCEVVEDVRVDVHLFIYPFNKHLLSTYCVLGTILGDEDVKIWPLPSTS